MDTERVRAEFEAEVNMSPAELERWLATDSSAEVGQHHDAEEDTEESVGHRSGRRIVDILRTNRDDLSADDYEHMRTVVGYIHRHRAQRPSGEVRDSRWRYSLMNWGHDPLKDTR